LINSLAAIGSLFYGFYRVKMHLAILLTLERQYRGEFTARRRVLFVFNRPAIQSQK